MEYNPGLPKKEFILMQLGHIFNACLIQFTWQPSRFVNHSLLVSFRNLVYHLFKLLEAIGAISKTEAKKAASLSGNYQDSTTASLSHDHDNDAAAQEPEEDTDQENGMSLLLNT